MLRISQHLRWIIGALIIIGALVGCSPTSGTEAVPTATIIPSTATPTIVPITPSQNPLPSATAIILVTSDVVAITSILETDIRVDQAFVEMIISHLAASLDIRTNRIQLVSVEQMDWPSADTLGCNPIESSFDGVTISGYQTVDDPITGYRYVLLVGDRLYEYHTEGTSRFLRCAGRRTVSGEVLIAVDPLAAETLRVVQNLLADELDLPSRRIQLVEMLPVTWEDTSLGCPQAGVEYSVADIPGYYIVVSVGGQTYIYHSDSNTAYPCSAERSIIAAE